MTRSWGHTVRLATDAERQTITGSEQWYIDHYGAEDAQRHIERWCRCRTKNCPEPVTHYTGYRYVTGKAGRTSSNERPVCEEHAKKFAEKHAVEMPSEPTERATRTGSMAVSDAIREMHDA